MADREDRDKIRSDEDCEKEFQPPVDDLCLPAESERRPVPCEESDEDCVDGFKFPEAVIPAEPTDFDTPVPLTLRNIEITLNCLEELSDTVGVYPTNVDDIFYWETLPGVSPAQLTYIAALSQAARNSVMGATNATIETALDVSAEQAEYFSTTFDAAVATAASKGGYGTSVTTPVGLFTDSVDWRTIPRITESKLDYISKLLPATQESAILMSPTDLEETFKLSTTQATYFRAFIDAKLSDLNAIAYVQTELSLRCYWQNEFQDADCPAAKLITSLGVTSYEIVAGDSRFHSYNSQEEANALAYTAALAELECWYGNDALQVDCGDEGFPDLVPGNIHVDSVGGDIDNTVTTSTGPGLDTTIQVGVVTVEALDTRFASRSGAVTATDAARVYAISLLECRYRNALRSATCAVNTGPDEAPITIDLQPGTPYGNLGQVVNVLPDYTVSEISQIDADGLAATLAGSLLDCYYSNPEVTATCGNIPIGPEEAPVIYIPNETVTVDRHGALAYSNTIPANTTRSYISKQEAEDQADALAAATLYCMYCSKEIDPLCDSTPSSLSLTLGMVEGALCGPDPASIQEEAKALARIPVVEGDLCEYGNDEVVGACVAGAGIDASRFPEGTAGVATGVYPPLGETVVIPANTIVVADAAINAAAAKANANAQAEALALAVMDCFYTNNDVTLECAQPVVNDNFTLHTSSAKYPEGGPDASPFGTIFIKKDTTFSYVSQSAAQDQAAALAFSMQVCLYGNNQVTIYCDTPIDEYGPGFDDRSNIAGNAPTPVLEDTVVTLDGVQSYQLASVIGAARLKCLFENEVAYTHTCGSMIGNNIVSVEVAGSAGKYPDSESPGTVNVAVGTVLSSLSIADADDRAEVLGRSHVNCQYTNLAFTLDCFDTYMGGDGSSYDATAMAPGAKGTVTVAAGAVVAPTIGGAQDDTVSLAASQLLCIYVGKASVTGRCDSSSDIVIHEITIPPGIILSAEGADDAEAQAQILADAITICGGSSTSTSTSTGTSTDPPPSGSSKDTAIVLAPWLGEGGYTALFVEEQPEVVFSDHFDAKIEKRVSRFKLDSRFFDVCERNTVKVVGVVPNRPGVVGVEVDLETNELIVRVGWFSSITRVTGRIAGVRKGFDRLRFPTKTREDFELNEDWLNRDKR